MRMENESVVGCNDMKMLPITQQPKQMPDHVHHEDKLNWLLGLLVVTSLGLNLLGPRTWLSDAVAAVGTLALVWEISIIIRKVSNSEGDSIFYERVVYERVADEDFWRLFGGLWVVNREIVTVSSGAFLIFSLFTVPLLFLLVTIAIVDVSLQKMIFPRVLGWLVFACILFGWQKRGLVEHYGVPIIGHFLEKPSYNAQYYVEAGPANASAPHTLLADIRVQNSSVSYETGEDSLGRTTSSTYRERGIWIKRLRLPNGRWVKVDQDEPLSLDDSGFVTDQEGELWRIKITTDKTN